jgi:dipeptidyl aminopeptidase/acylaminoacyl peptidase
MKRYLLLIAGLLTLSTISSAQEEETRLISPDGTYMFAKSDDGELFLDVYSPSEGSETSIDGKAKPTILFMFGGGFIQGQRDDSSYHKWFKMLTDNGFKVISIDYRLGLKGSNKVGIAQVNVLDKAIHWAVEDLFSATKYIIKNAGQLGVDPSNIVISGSSAGAITVMQAEYELCNKTKWASGLPAGFKYAGVMSFSGAILSREGELDYARIPAPTLMLHGTADELVNYKQIKFFNLGFFGGGKLVKRFEKLGFDYNMYHFVGYGHEIAGSMETTFDLQMKFIETNVMKGQRRIIEAWVDDPGVYKGFGVQSRKDLYGKK